jgi:uncharacterized membrane protein
MNIKKLPVHLHHIGSHFTNALFPVAAALLTLYLAGYDRSFEQAAFYCVAFGTLAAPLTYLAGVYDWKTRFSGRVTAIFSHKLIVGVSFTVLSITAVAIRILSPEGVAEMTTGGIIYIALVYLCTIAVTYLGHLGSKFV